MYAPRHRRFATGLVVRGEVQHVPRNSRFKMCTCAVRNNVVMVSCMRVQYFMQTGDEKLIFSE